jgi:hypothetical protein
MDQELTVIQPRKPLSAAEMKAQVQKIQEVMAAVMKKDVHYGVIPGTQKPSLWKPGAEKIAMTFHLVPSFDIEDLSEGNESRIRVACKLTSPDGELLGGGIGEASSMEDKYQWRGSVCDKEFDETPEDQRRTKWKHGKVPYQVKQIRTNKADSYNTILKMAKKRAYVDAILTVTAASDIFTQDLEEETAEQETPAQGAVNPPQRKSEPSPEEPAVMPTKQEALFADLGVELGDLTTKAEVDAWLKKYEPAMKEMGEPKAANLKEMARIKRGSLKV